MGVMGLLLFGMKFHEVDTKTIQSVQFDNSNFKNIFISVIIDLH